MFVPSRFYEDINEKILHPISQAVVSFAAVFSWGGGAGGVRGSRNALRDLRDIQKTGCEGDSRTLVLPEIKIVRYFLQVILFLDWVIKIEI